MSKVPTTDSEHLQFLPPQIRFTLFKIAFLVLGFLRPKSKLTSMLFRFMGIFWKSARIGERLSPYVSLICVAMAVSRTFCLQFYLPIYFPNVWRRFSAKGKPLHLSRGKCLTGLLSTPSRPCYICWLATDVRGIVLDHAGLRLLGVNPHSL